MSDLRAFEIQWGESDLASGPTTSIVVAANALEALKQIQRTPAVHIRSLVALTADLIMPPPPAPALPSRVLVLSRSNPYPGEPRALAVATSREALAGYVAEADRASFVAGETRELWESKAGRSRAGAGGQTFPTYLTLDEVETL